MYLILRERENWKRRRENWESERELVEKKRCWGWSVMIFWLFSGVLIIGRLIYGIMVKMFVRLFNNFVIFFIEDIVRRND